MKILHISSARALGGGERHLVDLVDSLAARGHDVHVALIPSSPLRAELGALPPDNIITLPLRNSLDAVSAHRLARFVRERGIDIVHAHIARDYPLAAFTTWRARRARLIITRHVLFPLGRIHRLFLAHTARIIAVSAAVAQSLDARRIFPAHKITVIPNGIDMARFDHAAHASGREDVRRSLNIEATRLIGTVGELSRVKGQEDFIRAAAIVARDFAGAGFVIVGEDASRTGATRARIETLIAELALEDRVRLLGHRDDIAQLIAALDIFVSASHTEAFGLAIVEAMASGTPVVATATAGAREIIDHTVTGQLVPVGDPHALAASISTLLNNPHDAARLSQHALQTARDRFSLARMVDDTEQVYRESLGA